MALSSTFRDGLETPVGIPGSRKDGEEDELGKITSREMEKERI